MAHPTGRDDTQCPPLPYRLRKRPETRWRATTPSGRILVCGIYDLPRGYDVRLEYAGGESVYARSTFEIGTARQTAAELRETVLAKPGFRELL